MDSERDRAMAVLVDALTALAKATRPELVERIAEIAEVDADDIADVFYDDLLSRPEVRAFLTSAEANERLKTVLAKWIRDIFCVPSAGVAAATVARNVAIGEMHARIHIPLTLLNAGMRVIKKEVARRLVASDLDRAGVVEAVLYLDDVLDTVLDGLHQSYLGDLMANVRQQQTLKMFMCGHNLALEGERLKAALAQWYSQVVVALYAKGDDAAPVPAIEDCGFGLWLSHKSELMLGGGDEVRELRARLEALGAKVGSATRPVTAATVRAIGVDVDDLGQALGAAIDRALAAESGRDPLTRLLTRQVMPTVLQREVGISLRQGKPFAVLLIEVDHVKAIGEAHGHAAVDAVLAAFAELLHGHVRAGDFIFRYGEEEFLVLLTEMDLVALRQRAENLGALVRGHPFLAAGRRLGVTASIGAAMHDGRPDYEETVERADGALFEAKRVGGDHVVLAHEEERGGG